LPEAEVLCVPADVTQAGDLERAVEATVRQFGGIDVLVNCAGRSTRGAVAETTVEDFEAAWQINFLSAVSGTRAALPHLLKSRGSVVLIGSLASKSASRFLGAYPASKFPLVAYAQQLRLELGPQGLHTLLVCPGPIRRDETENRYSAQAAGLPASAAQPGGGVKLKGLDPDRLAEQIVRGCERRKIELISPGKARLLFAIAALSPRLGDWLVRKMTGK
jgi:short-subunit dehydrogenase